MYGEVGESLHSAITLTFSQALIMALKDYCRGLLTHLFGSNLSLINTLLPAHQATNPSHSGDSGKEG